MEIAYSLYLSDEQSPLAGLGTRTMSGEYGSMFAVQCACVVLEAEASVIERRREAHRNRHLLSSIVSGESSTDCESVSV